MQTAVIEKPGISTLRETLRLVNRAEVLAIDLETTGLDPRRHYVRLITIHDGKRTCVFDCFRDEPWAIVRALEGKILIAHNAIFDLGFLWHLGLRKIPRTICTLLLASLLEAGAGEGAHGFPRLNLAACSLRYLNKSVDKELQLSDWSGELSHDQLAYARKDVEVLIPLYRELTKRLTAANLVEVSEIELRALLGFVWLAQSGVGFDAQAWETLARKAMVDAQQLQLELDRTAPQKSKALFEDVDAWNWSSPNQVMEVLDRLGFPVVTSNDAQLAEIDHPFADLLRKHRGVQKLATTYGLEWLTNVARDGRVYANWRQMGAASGRTSCSEPNLQQLPRNVEYRRCFRAKEGHVLIKADYSMLQLRIAAKWAKDPFMLKIFREGGDIHTETARALLNKREVSKTDRQIAKSANFGLLFGMSAQGLRAYSKATFGVTLTEPEATRHRETFFRTYQGLARWHASVKRNPVKETRSATGRRRILPTHASMTWMLNSPVQGDEACGSKTALALLWERRDECPEARPVLFCHDEIVVEVVETAVGQAAKWLKDAMLDGMAGILDPVPCEVEATVAKTWGG